jgi:hypothetical protein
MKPNSIINYKNFIFATRDSGYKNFSSAVAEIVDNSVEAHATIINIHIIEDESGKKVIISDNGIGMNKNILHLAFQFGGTTRHNSRTGAGRYGMGLPNSSLSQAKRFDVYSRQKDTEMLSSYLDIDDIKDDQKYNLRQPRVYNYENIFVNRFFNHPHGTIVIWSRCDRLENKKVFVLIRELKSELGRIFRKKIKQGLKIRINNEIIVPFDPLFLDYGIDGIKAKQVGDILQYPIAVPGKDELSIIEVKFSEFPVHEWSILSNKEKRKHKITQRAGCTVLRAGREIDYGWFFMGGKRKENYDDWWRCEISFEPELDELFGVTHTKQVINPTEFIKEPLVQDFENIARMLNRKVRDKFLELKTQTNVLDKVGNRNDYLIEKPRFNSIKISEEILKNLYNKKSSFSSVKYKLSYEDLTTEHLFLTAYENKELAIKINKEHLFCTKVLNKLKNKSLIDTRFLIELMIASMSRMYVNLRTKKQREEILKYNHGWSNILTSLLQ